VLSVQHPVHLQRRSPRPRGERRDGRPLATTLGDLEANNELANYNRIKAINRGQEPLTDEAADLELGPNNCAAS